MDHKDLQKYSDRNIGYMEDGIGSEAVARVPELMKRHADIFRLDIFHETREENVPGILAAGKVYSYDEVQKRKIAAMAGMTHGEKALDEIFNNVTHLPDSFTDYVYARPKFGGGKGYHGVHWKNVSLNSGIWLSFEDPNQLNDYDMHMVKMGMSVTKSFNDYDVYVGEKIPYALALRALENMANIDYAARFSVFQYDRQKALHDKNPRYVEPDIKQRMDFAAAAEYYKGIELNMESNWERYQQATYRNLYEESDAIKKELREAGLEITCFSKVPLSKEVLDHPEFEKIFVESCRMIARKASLSGQIALPREVSIKNADVYLKGMLVDKKVPAPKIAAPDCKAL